MSIMNAAITALIVAIVGVLGTLLAPIVSQRLSARARREEFEMQRTQQLDEYRRQQEEKVLMAKRACYITVISSARRYRLELMRYLFAVKEGAVDDTAGSRLEKHVSHLTQVLRKMNLQRQVRCERR